MVSQAEVIKNAIETNWNLTGELSKTESATMKEVVRFFDREQVEGNEWPKAVTVEKINAETQENRTEHPKFNEVVDLYTITCFYRVTDVDPTTYSDALDKVEQMATEVNDILETLYNPATPQGTFFRTIRRWRKEDHRDQAQVQLKRIMSLELFQLTSDSAEVFRGYGGVLVFDTGLSVADTKLSPETTDYTYTEAYNVELEEGFETIAYMTNDITQGENVPVLATGEWNGTFSLETMLKKTDVNAATIERLDNIYKMQANSPLAGELATVVLLQSDPNTEGTIATLTTTTFLKVNSIRKVSQVEDLVRYYLSGRIIKPTTWSVA